MHVVGEMEVVINRCFGGFSISDLCWERVLELGYSGSRSSIPRHDPRLIRAVKELGSEDASGGCAKLVVESLSYGYTIESYDGLETISDR